MLSFTSPRYGPLQYATDVFEAAGWRQRPDAGWRQNLRAIALGLEALRKVDRYGISRRGEQYVGWRELGAGVPMGPASMSVEEAAAFVAEASDGPWDGEYLLRAGFPPDGDAFERAYRMAAKRLHPDAGGSTEDFQRLQAAKALVDADAATRG